MVYRGKLSPACGWCRDRRLKCDQRRPSCSQCIRANRECYGYRDVLAGRFYDQSEEVRGKNRGTPDSIAAVNTLSPPLTSLSSSSTSNQVQSLAVPRVSIPLNDQATAFVFTHYVGGYGPSPASQGHLAFLPELLKSQSIPALTATVNAIGLAALSNIHRSSKLMLAARQEFITALAETNAALSDPEWSTSNATLAAVLLFGMYEMVTGHSPLVIDPWVKHVKGAMKLVELRGSAQFKDPIGLELFNQSRMNIVLSNIWLKSSTPSWLVSLSKEFSAQSPGKDKASNQLFILLVDVSNLCAEASWELLKEPVKVVKKALELDTQLAHWAMSVDPAWNYAVYRSHHAASHDGDEEDNTEEYKTFRHIYGDYYHVYPGVGVSWWWNFYRFARIMLQEVIKSSCSNLGHHCETTPNHYQQKARQSVFLSQHLVEETLASVPYYFGATHSSSEEVVSNLRTTGLIRVYWLLFIAADCIGSSPRIKQWVIQCLNKVGYSMGFNQALIMSRILQNGHYRINWLSWDFHSIKKTPDS